MDSGSEFQTVGPKTEKYFLPKVSREKRGTVSNEVLSNQQNKTNRSNNILRKSLPHSRDFPFISRDELSSAGVIDSGIVIEREKFHFPRNALNYAVGSTTPGGLGEEWSRRSVSTFYCP